MTYSNGIDTVVNPTEFLGGIVDHRLHRLPIRHVDLHGKRLILGGRRHGFASFGSCSSAFVVEIGEQNAFGACFGKGETDFSTNTASSLCKPVSTR